MASNRALQFYDEPLPGIDTSELRGKLVVIEGPDSVGRSTQVTQLRFWLEQHGHAVLGTGMTDHHREVSREPGSCPRMR